MSHDTPTAVHPASAEAFRTGRTTVYRGQTMRSRLEARVAALFDRRGMPWVYEPSNYADPDFQYLPDFRIGNGRSSDFFVEVKPPIFGVELDAARRRMETIYASLPDARLWLIRLDDNELHHFVIDMASRGDDDTVTWSTIEMDPEMWGGAA